MFIPNTTADLYVWNQADASNVFGKHTYQSKQSVRCSVIYLNVASQKSSVRADTSGTRGQAEQSQGDARFLVLKSTTLKLGDVIFKDGFWLEVMEFTPMRNVLGILDHNQVEFRKIEAISA